MAENSGMIWKIWKKWKSNSEKIWKIHKKIVKRYGNYERKISISISFHFSTYFSSIFSIPFHISSIFSISFHNFLLYFPNHQMIWKIWKKIVKYFRKYGRKISWIEKWIGKYGRKVSWIMKMFGKYIKNSKKIVEFQIISLFNWSFFHIF
jgi:hypothetical protein